MVVRCPYCGADAKLVTGKVVYPHRPDLAQLKFWQCAPCDAYVGCHKPNAHNPADDGTRPLGRLANATLRRLKSTAHACFDPLWKDGHMLRGEAYQWLAAQLGIPVGECHIGMFDEATCKRVITLPKPHQHNSIVETT